MGGGCYSEKLQAKNRNWKITGDNTLQHFYPTELDLFLTGMTTEKKKREEKKETYSSMSLFTQKELNDCTVSTCFVGSSSNAL